MIKTNAVFTKVADTLEANFGKGKISIKSEKNYAPSSFPFVSCIEYDAPESPQGLTLDFTDEQRVSYFEVEIFCNTKDASTQCRKIADLSTKLFKSMGYRCLISQPLDNLADANIKRYVCRYKRTICSGDEMPQ